MNNDELVIFDLDDTLLRGQSHQELLRYLYRSGLVPFYHFIGLSAGLFRYKLGLMSDPTDIMRRAYALRRGKSASDMEKRAAELFESRLEPLLFAEGMRLIAEHQVAGRTILLLSNSPDFLVKHVARYLHIHNFIGTRLEVKDGLFTGNIEKEIVYGESKLQEAKTFAEEKHFDLRSAWAYGDHSSDVFLLEKVGHPIAVNPTKGLRRISAGRSWPILSFS